MDQYQPEVKTYPHQTIKPNLWKRVLEINMLLKWDRYSRSHGHSKM